MCILFSSLANLVGSFATSRTWVQILLQKKKKKDIKTMQFSRYKKRDWKIKLAYLPRKIKPIKYNKDQIKSNLNEASKRKKYKSTHKLKVTKKFLSKKGGKKEEEEEIEKRKSDIYAMFAKRVKGK